MSEDIVLIAVDRLVQCANCGRDEVQSCTSLFTTRWKSLNGLVLSAAKRTNTSTTRCLIVSMNILNRMKEGW